MTTNKQSWIYPHQKEIKNKWWHRLAKIIFILALIIIPINTWLTTATSKFDNCWRYNLSTYSSDGYRIGIKETDPGYKEGSTNYSSCIREAQLNGIIAVIFSEAIFFIIANIFYYRIILYIAFGSPRKTKID